MGRTVSNGTQTTTAPDARRVRRANLPYPADWANSGVTTFTTNQQGRVYRKDLGTKTGQIAGAMLEYNPGLTGKVVKE